MSHKTNKIIKQREPHPRKPAIPFTRVEKTKAEKEIAARKKYKGKEND